MPVTKPVRIFVVDDHPLFRRGLKLGFLEKPGFDVVGDADNGFDAVEAILAAQPDVALIDADMPGLSGIGAIRVLRKALPDIILLILSAYDDDHYMRDAMSAGADGYLLKRIEDQELIRIVDRLCRNEPVFSPYLLNLTMDCSPEPEQRHIDTPLTTRETEVLRHLVEGEVNKEIAQKLFISCETVKSHVEHIYRKLHVTNRVEAARVASRHGLLE